MRDTRHTGQTSCTVVRLWFIEQSCIICG